MESIESILESEWSALNSMYCTEESDFMAQLLNYCSIPNDLHSGADLTISSDNTNVDHVSVGASFLHPTSSHDRYYAGNFDHVLATNDGIVFCNEEAKEEKGSLSQLLSNADLHENMIMEFGQEDQVSEPELRKDVALRNPVQKSKRSTNSVDVSADSRMLFFIFFPFIISLCSFLI